MDLADQIIHNNSVNPGFRLYDELGLPYADENEIDYIVARVFKRNPTLYVDDEGTIVVGRWRIMRSDRTPSNLVSLANGYNKWCRGMSAQIMWNRIEELAPKYSKDKIWITPTLLWDMKRCKLETQDYKENHI